MQSYSERIDLFVADLPKPSRMVCIGTIVIAWLWMVLYDLVITGSDPLTDYDFVRSLIPMIGLLPTFLRLLKPEDIENDQQAYQIFIRINATLLLVAISLLGIMALLIPLTSGTLGFAAHPIERFVTIHLGGLMGTLALPIVGEQVLHLYRYRSRRRAPRLAVWLTYGWLALFVLAQLVPLEESSGEPDLSDLVQALSAALSVVSVILSARARWIVNLRKRQKLALVGLSFLGMAATTFLIAMAGTNSTALVWFSPGIAAFVLAMLPGLAFTQLAICLHAFISLPTAAAIDRRNTEVSSLTTFARLLTRSFDLEDLADSAISIACDVTGGTVAWIQIDVPNGSQLLFGRTGMLPTETAVQLMHAPAPNGATLLNMVQRYQRVEVIDRVNGVSWSSALAENRTLCSVAAAPLKLGDRFLGALYVAKEKNDGFDREDLLILDAVADQVAVSIEHARLIRSSIERERIEQEMMIARDLQQRLLPRQMPSSSWFEIHAESEPAHLVGGDYYDIVSFSDGTLGTVIADVSGKGASAALYMGMIKGIIQSLSGSSASPKELLSKINVALYGNIDQRWFATMTCAQILEEERVLRIARAGHCPTLLVKNGEGSYSKPRGLGLAISRPILFDKNLEEEEIRFSPGDYAVFLSDGLPEAMAPNGEELGYERLLSITTEAARQSSSPRDLRDVMFDEISRFTAGEPQRDDSTLVVIRWQ